MNERLTVGSLFSGIGGLELGLERTGHFETRWQCEINEYARKVLAKNWPGLPIYNDIKELYESELPERVDVLCGGFPCQPFSTAGKRRGESDERFLWPEFVRVVREVQPRWVIAENVPGLLTIDSGRVFGRILGDLASCGYDAEWDTISAASVGALHPRNRIFIVGRLRDADRPSGQLPLGRVPFGSADAWGNGQGQAVLADPDRPESGIHPGAIQEAPGDLRRGASSDISPGCGQVLADAFGIDARSHQGPGQSEGEEAADSSGRRGENVPDAPGEGRQCRQPGFGRFDPQCGEGIPGRSGSGNAPNTQGSGFLRTKELENDSGHQRERRGPDITECNSIFRVRPRPTTDWAIEPDVGRVADGVPSRVDRLRCLGNAVVPQCAEYIGTRILEWEGLI